MSNSFSTQEDAASLWYEQSNYIATHLAAVGYGVHVAVFSIVTYITLKKRWKRPSSDQVWIGWLVFNTLLFAFGTINMACSIRFNQNAWINDREYPGGPFAYMIEQQAAPVLTLGNTAAVLASCLADALLLYRMAILWDYIWYIVIPPALFYIACVILSLLTVVQIALPTSWKPLSLPVWIILMILPMWLTALIAGRILYQKARVEEAIGKKEAQAYTGSAAIVIESALPFTLISIVLLGLFGDNNTGQNLFVALMVQIELIYECIAPEMIILRVILGRAWTRKTLARGSGGSNLPVHSQIEFASGGDSSHTVNSITRSDNGDASLPVSYLYQKEPSGVDFHGADI
ncbi:hypothetical protein D9757_008369 [Collybiopsis confluens]|uniref:Uncharacterized protein n=1 Tax=Collybiopsis confluens TaxID=2823264 RepID=A0A8H5HE63_9AGAR|nr:hypothetical protein D9757_008369 [Collybiopsis confluens]